MSKKEQRDWDIETLSGACDAVVLGRLRHVVVVGLCFDGGGVPAGVGVAAMPWSSLDQHQVLTMRAMLEHAARSLSYDPQINAIEPSYPTVVIAKP